MTRSRLTEDQRFAVGFDRPANLLISAAAGSGKTTTITGRIVERMLAGTVQPSQLLVITFTELAAKDLKVKIASQLRRFRLEAANPQERRRLDRLAGDLDLAQISTIHAFCNQILSAYLATFCDEEGQPYLEPGYRILEGRQEKELLEDSVESVLSDLYAKIDQGNSLQQASGQADPAPLTLTREQRSLSEWLEDFQTIARAYAPDLDDTPLRAALEKMLDQLRNLPDYDQFVADALDRLFERAEQFPSPDDFAAGHWWDLFDEAYELARLTLDRIRQSAYWREELPRSKLKTDQQLMEAVDLVDGAVARLGDASDRSAGRWDQIVAVGNRLGEIKFPGFSRAGKDPAQKERKDQFLRQCLEGLLPLVGLITDQIKRGTSRDAAYVTHYPSVFTQDTQTIRRDLRQSARSVARFMEVVLLVDREFKRRRFAMNTILFSDIEHGALKILKEADIRDDYAARFKEIYVDEYQDTSSIQDSIIRQISNNNLLMVGDIKQSIYRFRYANPALFAGHQDASCLVRPAEAIPELPSSYTGYLALLNRCFRTRPVIIDFINDFFSSFLTKKAGEIDYDETQKLFADRDKWLAYDQGGAVSFPANVRLEIATETKTSPTEEEAPDETIPLELDKSPASREALLAVRIIHELHRKGVNYQQIAILLPTNDNCRDYEEVLTRYGIPVTSRSADAFPDNLVFRQFEALFNLLDNPRQDFSLLSVLIGPFAPEVWSAEELIQVASIPMEDSPQESSHRPFFHDRFFQLRGMENHALAAKAKKFVDRMERWRFLAQELSFRDLLDLVIFETNYENYIAHSTFGESYLADLDMLLDATALPDPDPQPGIRGALRKMRRMIEGAAKEGASDTGFLPGAVRVLTRHSSKGLEWDYVILGRLDLNWQGRESRPLILLSEQEGLSSGTITDHGMTVINNPLHQAALIKEASRDRAEAWRLLYVAMTRAIHGLYLLLTVNQESLEAKPAYSKIMETVRRQDLAGRIPARLTWDLKNDAELLLAYLAASYPAFTAQLTSQPADHEGERPPDLALPPVIEELRLTRWKELYQTLEQGLTDDQPEGKDADTLVGQTTIASPPEKQPDGQIPFTEAARAPAKVTVTELQRLGLEQRIHSESEARSEPVWQYQAQAGPSRLERADMPLTLRSREKESPSQGALLGTTMHTVFQFLDLEALRGRTLEEAKAQYEVELDRLLAARTLSQAERQAALPFAAQAAGWADSQLATRLLAADKVYREMPFTLAVPSSRLDPSFPSEEISLIQGMIDLWFIENDEAILVDFKTDRLPATGGDQRLIDRYGIQLNFYSEAIHRATDYRVKEKTVWLIREARPVIFP